MLKRGVVSLGLALAVVLAPSVAQAQDLPSADEIMANYVKGIGGQDALDKLENRVTKGKFALPAMGIEATMTQYVAPPNMYSEVNVEAMGMVVETGVSDGVAWQMNPMQGNSIMEGPEAASMKRQAQLNEFNNWKEHFESVEVIAEETVGDAAAYKVEAKPKEGEAATLWFAKDSGLLVQQEAMEQGMTVTTTIGDYKEIDGVKVPHKIVTSGGPMDVEITFESIEHNVDLPDDRFSLPEAIEALKN